MTDPTMTNPANLTAGEGLEYRKTATIRASQWFKMGDHPAVVLKSAPNRYADEGIPWIETLEGGHVVTPGDWIATGVQGEHWPIKPDVFAATYQAVSDEGSLARPVSPLTADLHPDTAHLVNAFAIALAHKLLSAERKYGFSNGWLTDDWEEKCRADLLAHVHKGDPLDVAAYAAFCWAREWSTAPSHPANGQSGGGGDLAKEAAFLLDRLTDFEPTIYGEEAVRDWCGHVQPSIARLRILLHPQGASNA